MIKLTATSESARAAQLRGTATSKCRCTDLIDVYDEPLIANTELLIGTVVKQDATALKRNKKFRVLRELEVFQGEKYQGASIQYKFYSLWKIQITNDHLWYVHDKLI